MRYKIGWKVGFCLGLLSVILTGCYHSCLQSDDCGYQQHCVLGECQDKDIECTSDADCDIYSYCDSSTGFCQSVSPYACEYDYDCDTYQVCNNGQCVGKSDIELCNDTSCIPGSVCMFGYCVPVYCTEDSDCPAYSYCLSESCTPDYNYAMCEESSDCSPGYMCQSGHCIIINADEFCDYHADCPQDKMCKNGICVPNDGVKCKTMNDCHSGDMCTSDGYCEPIMN